jgi:hypothetical protein
MLPKRYPKLKKDLSLMAKFLILLACPAPHGGIFDTHSLRLGSGKANPGFRGISAFIPTGLLPWSFFGKHILTCLKYRVNKKTIFYTI